MKSWIPYFKLADDPFGDDPSSWRYYYGACYGIASLRLERAFEQPRGYVLVTGGAGTGKSTLVRSVLARVPTYAIATVSAAHRAPAAVIEALLRGRVAIDGPFSDTRKRAALIELIEHARTQKKSIVLVIEDAHLARAGQLRDLLTAVDITSDSQRVLQVVLVGRAPLIDTLHSPTLSTLWSRVATRVQMLPLNSHEVADYLQDRLEAVGAEHVDGILPPMTMRSIAQASRGVIALCDAITRRSLERAAATDCGHVTTEIVEEVATIYAGPPADVRAAAATVLRRLPRALVSGPVAAVVVLALAVAAIQVSLVHGPRGTIEAGLAALTGITTTANVNVADDSELAQRRKQNMRDTFLAGTPYDTEIAPPPRRTAPGSAATPSPPPLPMGGPPRKMEDSAVPMYFPGGMPKDVPALPSATPPAAGSTPSPTSSAVAPPPAAVKVGKGVSLQVGAFRELKSAHELRNRLQGNFADVHISTTDSGGEPLYRVRVGHFGTEDDATRMKESLQAAGFAAFRVDDVD